MYTKSHNIKKYCFSALLSLLAMSSCKQYHDLTARFNAYFLAKEKTMEVENQLFGKPPEDYNDVLNVLISIDTNETKAQAEAFEYIIEKASLPIQWHESSKWVDDCYLLIGKARMYQGDFMNAVLTFGYVRSNTDDPNARHAAIIQLIRTFIEAGELDNAVRMRDLLRKDKAPINEENTKEYHLVMGHFYRKQEDYNLLAQHLELALPLVKTRLDKARYNFLMGQVSEIQRENAKAYAYYQKARKFSPTYELAFYSDVSSVGLSEIPTQEEIDDIQKYFERLAKDEKNWEYRDKIYYEMAEFDERQKEYQAALSDLNESVQVSSNNVQKAYSYLKAGKIYYNVLKDYEHAALYYDSCMQVMPESVKYYEQTKAFAATLKEFVKYLNMVREQDRLLALAKMPLEERRAALQAEIEAEKEAILKDRENRKLGEQKRNRKPSVSSTLQQGGEGGGWYFYNSSAQVFGESNFIRVWGDRPLEDNWRRSNRERDIAAGNQTNNTPQANNNEGETATEQPENVFADVEPLDQRLAAVPTDQVKMDTVMSRLERGLFNLGKVYYYKLKEPKNALETFERLYAEFPKGQYTAEALYILYLMCQNRSDCDSEVYKQRLIKDHRESFYANILINPNYVEETNLAKKEVRDRYAQSYSLFKKGHYEQANALIAESLQKFPENLLLDKFDMLKVLIVGKTSKSLDYYGERINTFIERHPESELLSFAQKLQAGYEEKRARLKRLGIPTDGSGEQQE